MGVKCLNHCSTSIVRFLQHEALWGNAGLSSSKEKKRLLFLMFRLENICGDSANCSLVSVCKTYQKDFSTNQS